MPRGRDAAAANAHGTQQQHQQHQQQQPRTPPIPQLQPPQQQQPASPGVAPSALLMRWLLPCLLMLLGMRCTWQVLRPDVAHAHTTDLSGEPPGLAAFYYYNEATGQVQWEDPGDVPFEDTQGRRYWVGVDGRKTYSDPGAGKYAWLEQYSKELKRAYFINLETSESTWERPADLSWRRISVEDD